MADDSGNEDSWLYGDSNPEPPEESNENKNPPSELTDAPPGAELDYTENGDQNQSELPPPPDIKDSTPGISEEINGEQENGQQTDKDSDEDDSDDDVNVVIGDIKTNPTYTSLNIKRGGLAQPGAGVGEKTKSQPGKFSIDEFESIGTINGTSAQEFNLDSLEDKPWRKPGADITDYFNYGFNEDTWRAYCERQKRMRVHESGAGLLPMNPGNLIRSTTGITNDNSKYSGAYTGPRKAGPPPGRRMMGAIDVIGGNSGLASRRVGENLKATPPPKENVIQVMTADRREYSRKMPAFPDVSVPPPAGAAFEEPIAPPAFEPNYPGEFYNSEADPYYHYEPTQEQQWDPTWAPTEPKEIISTITPIGVGPPRLGPPGIPLEGAPSNPRSDVTSPMVDSLSQDGFKNRDLKEDSPNHERRSRDYSEKPERYNRERSHRRERSRSRSRRHKSRSRSPNHRSHKKKKSKRHESESE